ncbi:MAG: PKD domain-containing protein [Thermoplasmata archaeon]
MSPIEAFKAYLPLVGATLTRSQAAADVGQPVTFSAELSGGVGSLNYNWSGVPQADCPSLTSPTLYCDFLTAGVFTISLTANDSIGEAVVLGPTQFTVFPLPTAAVPTVTRSTADVNQTFKFGVEVSGGSGNFAYRWVGLPVWCLGSDTAAPSCLPETPGVVTGQVLITDGNGAEAPPSPPMSVTISSDPRIETSVLSPPTVVSGSPWSFSVEMEGGLGPYIANWTGLPPGCASATTSVSCSPTAPGTYTINGQITDLNGFSVYFGGATLHVLPRPAPAPTGLLEELPSGWQYLLVGAAGIIGFAVAGLTLFRMRRSPPHGGGPRAGAPVALDPTYGTAAVTNLDELSIEPGARVAEASAAPDGPYRDESPSEFTSADKELGSK